MKKINELLEQYLSAIKDVDLDRFETSYNGVDPAYARRVIKQLEHIFYDAYGCGKMSAEPREYLLAPTVLSSKRAGAAVLGVYLCVVDCEGRGENKGNASVLRIFVPEKYQQNPKTKDFLLWADHVNEGKIVYCDSNRMQKEYERQAISPYRNTR